MGFVPPLQGSGGGATVTQGGALGFVVLAFRAVGRILARRAEDVPSKRAPQCALTAPGPRVKEALSTVTDRGLVGCDAFFATDRRAATAYPPAVSQ